MYCGYHAPSGHINRGCSGSTGTVGGAVYSSYDCDLWVDRRNHWLLRRRVVLRSWGVVATATCRLSSLVRSAQTRLSTQIQSLCCCDATSGHHELTTLPGGCSLYSHREDAHPDGRRRTLGRHGAARPTAGCRPSHTSCLCCPSVHRLPPPVLCAIDCLVVS
jgi:hypothetical protein